MYKKRYSNSLFTELPGSDDYTQLPDDFYSGLGKDTSGSGFWSKINFNDALDSVTDLLGSIWGRNNTSQLDYINEQLKQEQRTNIILWVMVGLLLVLGVFLVVKKTK